MSELTLGTTSSSSSLAEAGDSRSPSLEAASENLSVAAQGGRPERQLRDELRGNVASSSHATNTQMADIVNQQVHQRLNQLLLELLTAVHVRDEG
jgi:hypothetical protein